VIRETRVVYTPAPAPTVVYQSPPPAVVYPQQQYPQQQYLQQQQRVTYSPPSNHGIAVTYRGPNGFQLAWQKATTYCTAHYGNTRVRLISDDRTAGRVLFACDQLSPPTVAYQQQQRVTYSPPSTQNVSVTYAGPNGFQLAWQKAATYCDDH